VTEEFGTWIGSNITPDPETGIGKWTDEQILAAVREGKRPDGTMIKPIMPYTFYTGMTDDDGKALVAFLRALPPVVNKVERGKMNLPDVPAPPIPRVDDTSDPVKHGQYLATLMHCAMCHTPMTEKGPDMSKMWAGGFKMPVPPEFGTGTIWSPNITSHEATGIGKYTEEDVITAVRVGVRPDKTPILPPMALYVPGWAKMTDDDAMALAKFIKSIPPIENAVPKSEFKPAGPPPGAGGGAPPPAPQ
jgi:mono/diheme cytochrome c family protein